MFWNEPRIKPEDIERILESAHRHADITHRSLKRVEKSLQTTEFQIKRSEQLVAEAIELLERTSRLDHGETLTANGLNGSVA